jgi:uracil-DNA glycosylase
MIRAGFKDEADFRARIYLSAMARCFPGRNAADSGDLPPSRAQRRNCLPWLAAELELLRPKVVITVGKMATDHFLGPGPLGDRVGQLYSANPSVLPLPHPSGQNRWLNVQENRDRLALALNLLSELRVFVR